MQLPLSGKDVKMLIPGSCDDINNNISVPGLFGKADLIKKLFNQE